MTVVDDWQCKGPRHRAAPARGGARERGGDLCFIGVMLAANVDMLDLMRRLGPARVVRRDGATVETAAALPEAAPDSGLEPALRLCADEHFPVEAGRLASSGRGWQGRP